MRLSWLIILFSILLLSAIEPQALADSKQPSLAMLQSPAPISTLLFQQQTPTLGQSAPSPQPTQTNNSEDYTSLEDDVPLNPIVLLGVIVSMFTTMYRYRNDQQQLESNLTGTRQIQEEFKKALVAIYNAPDEFRRIFREALLDQDSMSLTKDLEYFLGHDDVTLVEERLSEGFRNQPRKTIIKVPEQIVRRATQVAAQTERSMEEVLTSWLESAVTELPVEELSDAEVIALTEMQLTDEQQTTLSDLLAQNREGSLDAEGQKQLDEMMRFYEHSLLRKSQALRVAVQRELIAPLQA